MGTTFKIDVFNPAAESTLDDLRSRLHARLEDLENTASTYRISSEISQFNLNLSTEWIRTSLEFCTMVSEAVRIGQETAGAFDITVGPLVNLWGFGPEDPRTSPPNDSDIESTLVIVGVDLLQVDCDRSSVRKSFSTTRIDLSGWAKGYAVDQLALILDAAGMENYLVEIGGEIKVRGRNAENRRFAIAIESPSTRQDDEFSLIHVSDIGIATSGDYRTFFEHDGIRYSHMIDPRTGHPIHHDLSAVTVLHPSTAYADAIATALLVLGPDEGLALANEQGISAYFAVSTSAGIEFRSSDAFSAARYF